ncbi:MAG: amidohydrolase [Saprospiraceae bacterium]
MRSTLLLLALQTLFSCSQPRFPDSIYINAQIWTGDEANPLAQALAITDGIITATGTDDDIEKLKGPNTQTIDLQGKFVVPGFIDNHTHFLSGGHNLASVNLRTATTPAEFIQTMKDYVAGITEDGWITGGDWDHEAWGGELPRREWVDSITGNHSVFVSRLDGHMALANTKALELAGINRETSSPEGGAIIRDSKTGEPTGILKDEAMSLVFRAMEKPSHEELDAMFERAQQHALSLGITQVHDVGSFGGWHDLETYQRAKANGKLSMRIYSFVSLGTWERLAKYVAGNGRGDDQLRWGGLKGFVDGSLGSTTAWFYAPYEDAPETSGFAVTDTANLRRWILAADSANLHVAVHAIGDFANDWLLDVFREAASKNGDRSNRRFRIEHAQHLSTDAIPRFTQQNVIPSMQPYHAIDDGRWAEKRIGPERIKTTYAFRSLLDAKAPLTFGSDWTVAPLNPLEGIYAAVTRRTLDGTTPNGWVPEQKIAVEEALHCYTAANAYAGFQEDKLGVLKPGMLADFAVLSENLLEIAPEKIKDAVVLRTVVGGEIQFVRK